MKTLADFKRDAASGKIKLEMVERYGKTGEEIPERCRGIRTIQSVNTVEMRRNNQNVCCEVSRKRTSDEISGR